ncbi:MAG: HopJ type III effector protein [Burkholderiaceae bacterium]
MSLSEFLERLRRDPGSIEFDQSLALIDSLYAFTPTAFRNGSAQNAAGQNNGSCKLLAFGRLQGLTPAQMLACFGAYYRDDVLAHPDGTDHQNIRQFIRHGWDGVQFEAQPLSPLPAGHPG